MGFSIPGTNIKIGGSAGDILSKAGDTATRAVNDTINRGGQAIEGVQKIGSGDLTGIRDIGSAGMGLLGDRVGTYADAYQQAIEAGFGPLKGTPLYGMSAGNLIGMNRTVEGILKGNMAGIQDLPTDIGKAVQSGLDAGMDIVNALGSAMGGGGGGGSNAEVLESLRNLANTSAEYAQALPNEFQAYEGQRYSDPSDRTTQAENQLYNQSGSSIQNPYDTTGSLVGQLRNSEFGGALSGPQTFAPTGIQTERDFGNAVGARDRSYSGMDVNAAQTAGAQEFNANTYGNAATSAPTEAYSGKVFEGANYNPAAIQGTGRDYSKDALQFQGQQYGNAVNANAQNYGSGNTFQQDLAQYENPYQDAIIQSSIGDLSRARELQSQQTDAAAHAAGAFGGSRHGLREAEDTSNYYKSVADLSNQMRSQGFDRAAQMAAQERGQRLGLTAQAQQQSNQLGTQGALQGQQLTAGDLQAARDATLRSQLQANQLGQQGNLQTQQLQAQAGMQGQSLTADAARQAQQLMAQTGMQGQQLTADSRNQINQLNQQGALQGQSLTAADATQARGLNQQSYDNAAQRQLQSLLQSQNLGTESGMQAQRLGADAFSNFQNLMAQGALAGQSNTLSNLNAVQANNLRSQLAAQQLGATSFDNQQNRALDYMSAQERYRQGALSGALSGANYMGNMGQNLDTMQRQQLLDRLAVGQYADQRQDRKDDFAYQQYLDRRDFPGTYLDNLNKGGTLGLGVANATAQGAGAGGGQSSRGGTGNPLMDMITGGIRGYISSGGNPWGAAAGAGMQALGVTDDNTMTGMGKMFSNKRTDDTTQINPGNASYGNTQSSGQYSSRGGGRMTGGPLTGINNRNPMTGRPAAKLIQQGGFRGF